MPSGLLLAAVVALTSAAATIPVNSTGATSGAPSISLPLPGATTDTSPVQVLPPLGAVAPAPTAAGLTRVLAPLLTKPSLGRSVSAEVIDTFTGAELYTRGADRAVVPASTAKLLTGAAALSVLGPQTTLATRVVLGTPASQVVLVGGGDLMLAPGVGRPDAVQGHAGLGDLAAATARQLRSRGTTAVAVRLDDTLFRGPAINPAWPRGDVAGGYVAPVMSVEVTVGVTRPGRPPQPGLPAARVPDPALAAATLFAAQLRAQGITVTPAVTRGAAPASPTVLAQVASASIADIVEHDLTDSDNTTAEALARLVAIAGGRPGSFADGGRAVLEAVHALGVPVIGARMTGGSGLGVGTVLPTRTIARTLAVAASDDHPALRPLLTGLPVAGASGTLEDRFSASGAAAGIGVVRAKTGTLSRVGSLAGTVVDADGRLLAFVLIADAVPGITPGRSALDAIATSLAGCGCR
ncbi:MAG TPA: D-alanyl-D-alanine carboxypeptidase/D-alanyl-D-alanine-endopeptidase [Kineosporiaceae bacterium]|nr:D-alanyl-D-alanine carboxypeptidase/D-alanyl-D-alanine-endopeptidase [Kineosporiaceae bacterium]